MPPLLSPSPILLDQSFPRDRDELLTVADALGELAELMQNGQIELILTQTLAAFVESTDWTPPRPYDLLRDIYNLLCQLFLRADDHLLVLDLSHLIGHRPHPLPVSCKNEGLVELWSDELGRILLIHDASIIKNEYFIGIACSSGFSGGETGKYNTEGEQRAFPLVGPNSLDCLHDAYKWDVPAGTHRIKVSFAEAKKNCYVIGATRVEKPSGGSHYKVRFTGKRSWALDKNHSTLPDDYLKELCPLTGYPLDVIKVALVSGVLPKKSLRLQI